jgi:hypothetical protein
MVFRTQVMKSGTVQLRVPFLASRQLRIGLDWSERRRRGSGSICENILAKLPTPLLILSRALHIYGI